MDDFEKNINASDLIDWIMCAFPDWCVGDVRGIVDHVNEMPSVHPEVTWEQIVEYCHKRCLAIVDAALLHEYAQAEIRPKIIRCRDCFWFRRNNRFCEGCANMVEDMPTIEPVRKGHWIFIHPLQDNDSGAYMCSVCNTGDWDIKPTDKYCKFCGAKMEGVIE